MACTSCKKKKTVVEPTVPQEIVSHTSHFEMRENTGVFQISFGSGLFISNANMTDELAIQFLKENPNRISLFSVYPDNWKTIIKEEPQAEPEAQNKATSQRISKSK